MSLGNTPRPVRVDGLERAEVELARIGPIHRNFADQQLVKAISSEHVPGRAVLAADDAYVLLDRWPGFLVGLDTLSPKRRPPAVVRTKPPRSPRWPRLARISGCFDEVPEAEPGMNAVGIELRVGTAGLIDLHHRDPFATRR